MELDPSRKRPKDEGPVSLEDLTFSIDVEEDESSERHVSDLSGRSGGEIEPKGGIFGEEGGGENVTVG